MDIQIIAKACHEVNRAFCAAIGDNSQVPWEEAPEWQREATFAMVKFRQENPEAPTSATHDEWADAKIRDGWVYGPVKDAETKTHPCILPFEELPTEQQAKDVLIAAVIKYLS